MKFQLSRISNLALSGCLFMLSLSGCKSVYTPAMQNVPMLQEKNDIKVNLNKNNLQAAYAVTENIGVMANGSFHSKEWSNVNMNNGINEALTARRFNAEGGVGYFKKYSETGLFEVYGGGGFGNVNLTNHQQPENNFNDRFNFSANAVRMFVQPSISTVGKKFEAGISTRLVALKYSGINTTYPEALQIEDRIFKIDQPTYMFAEPALTMRYGNNWIKLQTQMMYSAKLTRDNLNYNPFNMNFSLYINLSNQNQKQILSH